MTTVFSYEPVGLDLWDARHDLPRGTRVYKTQPHGCPRNGTMGHCYVSRLDDGRFVGLVLENSLQRIGVKR
jgi:hypothetical protein